VDASPFREVTWQHSPLATALQHIEYSTEYIIEIQRSRFRLLPGFLKKRSYFLKLFPSDITWVLFAHTRCVELLVCLVLYHFVGVLVKKILNRFSVLKNGKLLNPGNALRLFVQVWPKEGESSSCSPRVFPSPRSRGGLASAEDSSTNGPSVSRRNGSVGSPISQAGEGGLFSPGGCNTSGEDGLRATRTRGKIPLTVGLL
jgi:hypothetical protein